MTSHRLSRSNPSPILGWISLAARIILGGALLVAGSMKIGDIAQSVVAVRAYEFPIPNALVTLIGYGLPVIEIIMGLAILLGVLTRWSALIGAVMILGYIAAIMSAWARGLTIDCGCFTPGGFILDPEQETQYLEDILRDIGLGVCATWLIIFPASRFSVDRWLRAPDSDNAESSGPDTSDADTPEEVDAAPTDLSRTSAGNDTTQRDMPQPDPTSQGDADPRRSSSHSPSPQPPRAA